MGQAPPRLRASHVPLPLRLLSAPLRPLDLSEAPHFRPRLNHPCVRKHRPTLCMSSGSCPAPPCHTVHRAGAASVSSVAAGRECLLGLRRVPGGRPGSALRPNLSNHLRNPPCREEGTEDQRGGKSAQGTQQSGATARSGPGCATLLPYAHLLLRTLPEASALTTGVSRLRRRF